MRLLMVLSKELACLETEMEVWRDAHVATEYELEQLVLLKYEVAAEVAQV